MLKVRTEVHAEGQKTEVSTEVRVAIKKEVQQRKRWKSAEASTEVLKAMKVGSIGLTDDNAGWRSTQRSMLKCNLTEFSTDGTADPKSNRGQCWKSEQRSVLKSNRELSWAVTLARNTAWNHALWNVKWAYHARHHFNNQHLPPLSLIKPDLLVW